jgi:hypothetical protein
LHTTNKKSAREVAIPREYDIIVLSVEREKEEPRMEIITNIMVWGWLAGMLAIGATTKAP